MRANFLMVNYNDYENVKKVVNMIEHYKIIDKIVIVDNCSTDDSLKKIKELENDRIIILESDHNGGYGYGINVGAQYLNGISLNAYIIVSNTDIIINSEDDIRKLLDTFTDNTAVVAPIIKEHAGYNCGWKVPFPWQDIILSIPGIYKKYQKKFYYDIKNVKNKILEVEAMSGSFFIIKGSILKEVDYFDENLFLYYEENVLAKKLQQIQQKILINGTVEVFHNHSITIDKAHTSVQKYKILKESQYYFQTKYNHAGMMHKIVMKLLFTSIAFGLYLRSRIPKRGYKIIMILI